MDIARSVKCEEIKVESFFKLGKHTEDKKKLIKVCLDFVNSKHKILGGTKVLRVKKDGDYTSVWGNVFPDLTKEDREKSKTLRSQ